MYPLTSGKLSLPQLKVNMMKQTNMTDFVSRLIPQTVYILVGILRYSITLIVLEWSTMHAFFLNVINYIITVMSIIRYQRYI